MLYVKNWNWACRRRLHGQGPCGCHECSGCCFQYHLGKCFGACIGKESPEKYNERFTEAFAKIRVKSWPFPGEVTLPEDPEAEEGTAFVIDQWRIIKKIEYTNEGYTEIEFDQPFDYDTYRILSKHLIKNKDIVVYT